MPYLNIKVANATSNMTRRDFLKVAVKTAAVSSGFLTGCATVSPGGGSKLARAIDIHHHYFAPELISEIKQHGKAIGIEYFPPKDAKDNPYQIQFPKAGGLHPIHDWQKCLIVSTP